MEFQSSKRALAVTMTEITSATQQPGGMVAMGAGTVQFLELASDLTLCPRNGEFVRSAIFEAIPPNRIVLLDYFEPIWIISMVPTD